MSIIIDGRIEYLDLVYSLDEASTDCAWQSWMDLSSVIVFNDEINWKIFGNPKDFMNVNENYIAKQRGFPVNPGYDLQRDIEEFKKSDCKNEYFGFTNFLYSEIEDFDWKTITNEESDWLNLFKLIENFMLIKKISSERIRITAWYLY